ncbi:hypothetical protein [Desulfurobacterium atlanticum]|uniref:Predicted nucleotide-binding protein, sugar kinase/HSP70/actin superfamily n=1 Tax=Desulfurobacterium atlanticum TaxID=240169 RepID=A0A238Z4Z4_9BACT|nr:hypothetical protein [Desulfurobacterium atlanticum]SNR78515.1 Predicted nucleotide-binding protein, sugar kinase/HSP70/actin superfamily [Desulfurobacterium atlanticum]
MKTLIFGGLTPIHDKLLEAAVKHLGYNAKHLPQPDIESLKIGREFCNKGMCNPAYFTVGNLLKFLINEKEKGVDVEKTYLFITIGACGPCRFGMYETEYKSALKEAGFESLEMTLLNQTKFSAEGEFKITKKLIYNLMKAVIVADLLRDISYQIRPYEIESGKTDKILTESTKMIYNVLKNNPDIKSIIKALKQIKKLFETVNVDYSKVKPIVNVIGEFWVQTTEGDGNYNIHRWLEKEGAEVKVEPISGWIEYQIFTEIEKTKLEIKVKGKTFKRYRKIFMLKVLLDFYRCLYESFRKALGNKPRSMPDQKLLWELAKPYYDPFVTGGEGHLEVAKHIYNVKFKKAHMTLSLKPFGCMPSTQSDGVQTKVLSDYPESIFVSVETSGDSEVNAKSRIQMKLYEAKEQANIEYERVLEKHSLSAEEVKTAVKMDNSLQNPFIKLSRNHLLTAAKFVDGNYKKIRSINGRTLHRKGFRGIKSAI